MVVIINPFFIQTEKFTRFVVNCAVNHLSTLRQKTNRAESRSACLDFWVVDLIPSSIDLSGMETNLVNAMSREFTLRSYLGQVKHEYDHIIIDCPPSLSMLTINALAASNSVIVPVQAQYLPAKGMTQLMKTIGKVRKQINPDLKVDGVLLTLADMRTNLARVTVDTLRQQYGSVLKIYRTQIPIAVKAAEISAAGQSIFTYDKGSKVAQAYAEFTKEVLADETRAKAKPAPGR